MTLATSVAPVLLADCLEIYRPIIAKGAAGTAPGFGFAACWSCCEMLKNMGLYLAAGDSQTKTRLIACIALPYPKCIKHLAI